MKKYFPSLFLISALLMLLTGIVVGVIISINYVNPDFVKLFLPFNQLRPIHITSVVSWIVLAATGGIYYYLRDELGELYSPRTASLHYLLFFITAIGIFYSLLIGKMGGREYLVFPPYFMLPILLGWILFAWNYFKTISGKISNWPVYYWMWGTGIIFMIFHLCESNLWAFDFFRKDFVKDMTIQWKSYGSFVGSWNLMVYGTAIYLMAKIKNDDAIGRGKLAFFFYFLGLTNLMFGWAHHTYVLPTALWIRYLAYGISMTEWILFIRMIYVWKKSLTKEARKIYPLAFRFLMASDFWVFLNLLMALLMSIPILNYYSHGTHITVAHSMGTTIGINTMILFASIAFILEKHKNGTRFEGLLTSFYFINISLLIFWCTLIAMGIKRAYWYQLNPNASISNLHAESYEYYILFICSGIVLCLSIAALAIQFLKGFGPEIRYMIYSDEIKNEIDHLKNEKDGD